MITLSELYPIGYVAKTHGIKGELNIALDTPYEPGDFRFIVLDIDAIFVPFAVTNARGQGQANRLVSIKGVDTVEEARDLVGKTVYVLKRELHDHPDYDADEDADGLYLSDLVDFTLTDENDKPLGQIIGFNDDTQNYLLEVQRYDGTTAYIPYVDEWVTALDPDNKTISLDLPTGLLDNSNR